MEITGNLAYCDRAAEWIPPWTGGSRLISLWDMKEYLAERIVGITENIVNAQCALLYMDVDTQEEKEREPKHREELRNTAKAIFKEAGFLSLKSTEKQAARLYQYAENKPPGD